MPYLGLLGEKDTALGHMNKYHALRKAIETVAGQLGTLDVRDNPDTHEFYFTLLSSTLSKIKKEVNERNDEIITSVGLNKELYEVQVITV